MKILQSANVLVISHGYRLASGGPAQDLRDFLKNKVSRLDYIDHPFPHADYKQTHFFFYNHGILKTIGRSIPYVGPEIFRYIQQFIVIFLFLLFSFRKYDICFALDNHSLIAVSFFRKISRIRKLVYYSIDYIPMRFTNRIINNLYHLADRIACHISDTNWVVAKHMIQARKNNGVNLEKTSPFREVPMGFHRSEIVLQPINKIDRFHLVYMGTILEKQGLQLIIEALPEIVKELPKIHLTIIGTGNYENTLKTLVKKLKVKSRVTFKGFIADKNEMYTILTTAAIGLAPYKPDPESFSYYADPSKIKIYLGCGLPVITTHVTKFSKIIENTKAGIIIDYDIYDFCKAVTKLISSSKLYKFHRNNAVNLSANYVTEEILKKAIEQA